MIKVQNQTILYGIIGLLLGIMLTVFFASNAVNNNNTGMMRMMGIRTNMMQQQEESKENMMEEDENKGMGMSMDEMMQSMEGKEGDEFDRAFMESMTIHHQGAIEMAQKIWQNTMKLKKWQMTSFQPRLTRLT